MGPLPNNKAYMALVFAFYVFLTNFFILNVIVTTLISSFYYQTHKQYKLDQLSK